MVPLIGQRHAPVLTDHHDALMGAVGLVSTEQIDIAPQRAHISKAMRRIGYAIHTGPRARRFRQGADASHIIDRTHNIRAMREHHKRHIPLQELGKVIKVQLAHLGINPPLKDIDAILSQPPPRAAIGLVVLIGHNNALARLDPFAHRLCQHIGILRGRGPKRHLMRGNPQHFRQTPARLVHLLATQARRRIGRIGLHFAFGVKPTQAVNHLSAGIGPASVFKKGLSLQ